eukprot:6393-Heterococcus_DN1.PRE.7
MVSIASIIATLPASYACLIRRQRLVSERLPCITGKQEVAGILEQQRNVLAAAGATFSNLSRKRPYTPSGATTTAAVAAAAAAEAYTPVPAATPGALVVLDAATAQPCERFTLSTVRQQQALSNPTAAAADSGKATSGKQTAVASVTPAPRRPLQHRVTFATDSPTVKTSKSSYDVVHDYSMLKALLEAKLQQCEQGSSAFSTVLSDIAKVDRELARLQQADSYKCTDATAVRVVDESVACTPAPEPWSRTVTSSSSNSSSMSVYSSARPSVFHAVRSEAAGAVDVALSKHVYRRSTPSTDMKVRFSLDDDVCSNSADAASTNTHSISALKAVVEQSSDTSSSSISSSSSSSGNSAPATPPRSARPVQNTAPRNHHILQLSSQLTPATASSTQTFTNIGSRSNSTSSNSSSTFDRLCSKITTGSRRSAIQQQQQQWEADAVAVAGTECCAIDVDKVVMLPPCGFGDWAVIASAINVNANGTGSANSGTLGTVSSSAGVNNLASLFSAAATAAPAVTVAPQQQQLQQRRVTAAATDAAIVNSGSSDAAVDDEKAVCTGALWKGSVEMSDSPAALACALFTRSKSEMRCSSTAATERSVRSNSSNSGQCDDSVKTAKDMPKEQQWWVRSDELLNSSSSSVGVDDSTEHDAEHTTGSSSSSGSGSGTHSGSSSDCEDRGQSVAHLVSIVDTRLSATEVQQLMTPEQSPTRYANTANFWAKSAVKPAAASAVKAAATSTAAHRVGAGEIAVVDSAVSSSTATSAAVHQVAQQQEQVSSAAVTSQGTSDTTATTTADTSSPAAATAAAVRAVTVRPVMRQLSGLFNAEHSTALAVVDSTFDFSEANKENIPPHYAVMSVNKKQQQCKKSVHLTAALQFQRYNENTATTAAITASSGRVLGVAQQPQQQLSARQALAGCAKATNSK